MNNHKREALEIVPFAVSSDTPLLELITLFLERPAEKKEEKQEEKKSTSPVSSVPIRNKIHRAIIDKIDSSREKIDVKSIEKLAETLEEKIQKKDSSISSSHHIILAILYQNVIDVPNKNEKIDTHYQEAIKQEDPIAMNSLGIMYGNGQGVAKDEKKAVEWFQRSAELGNAMAMCNLGYAYWDGRGVAKDEKKAVEWYQRSAELGDTAAMFNLGVLYLDGRCVVQDDKEAFEWFQRSAELGNAAAMNNLGFMYKNGRGIAKDEKKAVEWYQRSAALGNAAAMQNLAVYYYATGRGGTVKDVENATFYARNSLLHTHSEEKKHESYKQWAPLFLKENLSPTSSYHAATTVIDDRKFSMLARLLKEHPAMTFRLFLEDLHSLDAKIREGTSEVMDQLFDRGSAHGIDQIPEFHRIKAQLFIKAMTEQDVKGFEYLTNLNKQFLTPEENFEIGFYLYNHMKKPKEKLEKFENDLSKIETPEMEEFSGKLANNILLRRASCAPIFFFPQSKILETMYGYLKEAASHGHKDAISFLILLDEKKNEKEQARDYVAHTKSREEENFLPRKKIPVIDTRKIMGKIQQKYDALCREIKRQPTLKDQLAVNSFLSNFKKVMDKSTDGDRYVSIRKQIFTSLNSSLAILNALPLEEESTHSLLADILKLADQLDPLLQDRNTPDHPEQKREIKR